MGGIWKTDEFMLNIVHKVLLGMLAAFIVSEYTYICLKFGSKTGKDFLKFLSYAFCLTILWVKISCFQRNFKEWHCLFSTLYDIELTYNDDTLEDNKKMLTRSRKTIRKLSIYSLVFILLTYIAQMVIHILQDFIFSSTGYPLDFLGIWIPFVKDDFTGYIIKLIYQLVVLSYGSVLSPIYNSSMLCILLWFRYHLIVLKGYCSRLADSASDENTVLKRIRKCQQFHLSLLLCCRKLNELHSPVMFVSLIFSALMLGATEYSLVYEQTSVLKTLSLLNYLGALLLECFLFYWFSDDITNKFNELSEGVWESAWWRYGVKVRRSLLVLMCGLNIRVVFTAGPFNEMTVATYLAILKTSYSAYALLTNAKD